MRVNHRHHILIFVSVITFLVTASCFLFLYKTVIKQNDKSREALQMLSDENDRKAHEQELTTLYKDMEAERTKISSYVVYEDKIVDFIEAVENIGNTSGNEIVLSTVSTEALPKTSGSLGYISAHVNTSGSFGSIARTLLLLENMSYSIELNNLKLNNQLPSAELSVKGATRKSSWNMSVDIKVLAKKS